MKKDLATAITTAIIGFVIAFFVTRLFIPEVADVSYKAINSTITSTVTDPDPEVFNYKAINPTVEVHVGDCDELDEYGECKETETVDDGGGGQNYNPERANE